MIDENLYRETFSRLRASGEAKKEVLLKMNETKKSTRRPWKALRAAGLAAMLTVALAVSANAASGGELLESIYRSFAITLTTTNGDETFMVNVSDGVPDGTIQGLFSEQGSAVTEERDGRLYLKINGEETDITDALTQNGEYTMEVEDGDVTTIITVQGTVEDHMILSSAEDSNMYYVTTSGSGQNMGALDSAKAGLQGTEEVQISTESRPASDVEE